MTRPRNGNARTTPAFDAVNRLINKLENILQGMFGTNWAVLVQRLDDGTIGWKKVHYDCGY